MKPGPAYFVVCFALLSPLHAAPDAARQSLVRASIPDSLVVPEFTPPVPVPPKQVPAMRVDASTTVPSGNGKTLTILRGEPSTLPDIPPPPAPPQIVRRERTADELARERYRRRHSIQLGATIYDHKVSVVRWHHPDTREPYEAVCGFDVGLLAGIGRFARAGENYSLTLLHSAIDTTRARNRGARGLPDHAGVTAGSIRFVKGPAGDPVGTAAINLIKELLSNEKTRLEIFQADLERHQKARAAWEKANPVPPRDGTVWIRPHRGSRYLTEPAPEAATR